MRTLTVLCAIGALSFSPGLIAQSSPGQDGCKAYYALEPLDLSTLKLLSTPVVPPKASVFANAAIQQLREWDLPSKVTSWRERPSPEELARRWEELNQKFNPAQGRAGVPRPYGLLPLSSDDWQDLAKWFAKDGPKKLPGLCVDRDQATYVLAVGIISDGTADTSSSTTSARIQYAQSGAAGRQDTSVGPNAATVSPGAHENTAQELSRMGAASGSAVPGVYTCTYLYRTDAAPTGRGGKRRDTPDYYYCKSSGEVPRSAVTTMLKYLAKKALQ